MLKTHNLFAPPRQHELLLVLWHVRMCTRPSPPRTNSKEISEVSGQPSNHPTRCMPALEGVTLRREKDGATRLMFRRGHVLLYHTRTCDITEGALK
jgi:hypothetical protein